MSPHALNVFGCVGQVLVQTQSQNYRAADALQMLKDLNLTQQVSASGWQQQHVSCAVAFRCPAAAEEARTACLLRQKLAGQSKA